MDKTSSSSAWFSTLMALGTIGILLIIVTGLATLYINEMQLSRISYDEIIAANASEWAFEYGMLKVRNHREWFQDSVDEMEPDGAIFHLTTEKSRNMKTSYSIKSNSSDSTFPLEQNEHIIIPLFSAKESLIQGATYSKKPLKNTDTILVKNLEVTWMPDLSWTIVAMSGSESTGLSGSGNITSVSVGRIRERAADCYDTNGQKLLNCLGVYAEMLQYFFDRDVSVWDFLSDPSTRDPYLMIYNPTSKKNITIHSDPATPFTLPVMEIEATAIKNWNLQVFRFTEDKSRYYDALKYGIYNNQ